LFQIHTLTAVAMRPIIVRTKLLKPVAFASVVAVRTVRIHWSVAARASKLRNLSSGPVLSGAFTIARSGRCDAI
jgi:hypothetical protein